MELVYIVALKATAAYADCGSESRQRYHLEEVLQEYLFL